MRPPRESRWRYRRRADRRPPLPREIAQVDDVVVAILTGGRPELLSHTLFRLQESAGKRMGSWDAVALVNGGDKASLAVLERHPWVRVESRPGRMRKIGPAVSELMKLAGTSGRKYVLHLEDDWGCGQPPSQWLDKAAHVLKERAVGQVRLRSSREKVMRVSMVTGARIRWQVAPDHERSSNAHFTFNPNLMRAEDLKRVYPCQDEPHAQRKFGALGLDVVQLLPGSFSHLGGTRSLRRARGGEH